MWRRIIGLLISPASYYKQTPNPTPRKYFLKVQDYIGYLLLYPLLLPFKRRKLIKNPKKILVVMLDSLGDLLLSTPAIHALRDAYPNGRIDLVVNPAHDIFEHHPMINNKYYFKPSGLHPFKNRIKWFKNNLSTVKKLRKNKYDIVIDLRAEYYTLKSAFLFGGKQLVSQSIRNGGFLLDCKAPDNGLQHEAERKLSIIEYVTGKPAKRYPLEYYYPKRLTEKKYKNIKSLFKLNRYIVIHPFASWKHRTWAPEQFSKLIKWLINEYGYKVVMIGARNEIKDSIKIERMVNNKNLINFTGKVTLNITAILIKNADLFIGHDSGPLHLASAIQENIIALFGPNIPLRYGPWQRPYSKVIHHKLPCCPCPQTTCNVKKSCMKLISTSEVQNCIKKIINDIQNIPHKIAI